MHQRHTPVGTEDSFTRATIQTPVNIGKCQLTSATLQVLAIGQFHREKRTCTTLLLLNEHRQLLTFKQCKFCSQLMVIFFQALGKVSPDLFLETLIQEKLPKASTSQNEDLSYIIRTGILQPTDTFPKEKTFQKSSHSALAGVTRWSEPQPVNRREARSIPRQGTCLGCGPGPQLRACERQPVNVSLTHERFSRSRSPSLLFFLKLNT